MLDILFSKDDVHVRFVPIIYLFYE